MEPPPRGPAPRVPSQCPYSRGSRGRPPGVSPSLGLEFGAGQRRPGRSSRRRGPGEGSVGHGRSHPPRTRPANIGLHAAACATRAGFSLVSGIRGLPGLTNPEAGNAAPARAARVRGTASPRDPEGWGWRRHPGPRARRGPIARVWPWPAFPRSAGGKSCSCPPPGPPCRPLVPLAGSQWAGPWSCWAEASAAWPPVTT